MIEHNRISMPRWLLLGVAVVLIMSHALILRFALQHKSMSVATVAGVLLLVVMVHLGLLRRLYVFLQRRSRQ